MNPEHAPVQESKPEAESRTNRHPTRRKSRIFRFLPWLLGGVVVLSVGGFLIYWSTLPGAKAAEDQAQETTQWTCAMHPQIILPKPGKCPICFMDLIPLKEESGENKNPRRLTMSNSAEALADIQTSPVKREYATAQVRMVGKIVADETRVADITAWVGGRLDRLFVDYTGISVRKGDHLVSLYSPDLIVAQEEYLRSVKATEQGSRLAPELAKSQLKSSEEKLRLLGLLPQQIEEIKKRGTPSDHLTIYAPIGGVVLKKYANEGAYVDTGTKIYTVADLSVVWVDLEAYESDLPWLRYGQRVEFTTESRPGEVFEGRIAFIDPVLDEKTRTVPIRVNAPNPGGTLKPGMFVRAVVQSRLDADGNVFDASLIGKWICPMHPEVVKDRAGKCDVCGMDLVSATELGYSIPSKAPKRPLVIPATAPLITGKRAVVYVKVPDTGRPTFEGREVILGPRAGDEYVVRYGLKEGEQVVTNGNFKIDSALQIRAKPSMMNPPAPEEELEADEPVAVPSAFRVGLNPVYEAYLGTSAALAKNDLAGARKSLAKVISSAEGVDAAALERGTRDRWNQICDRLLRWAHEAAEAKDLDAFRESFVAVSGAATRLIASFGQATEEPIYEFHCPLAAEAEGADWLQRTEEVHNPYFGPAMPSCGERVATFESLAPLKVPETFRAQLAPLYEAYLKTQAALADDRVADAAAGFDATRQALDVVNADALSGRTLQTWDELRKTLAGALREEKKETDIEALRIRFEPLSHAMLELAGRFGHARGEPLYRVFCPMAFENKGAPWLQAGETVANPYFGHTMLRCGEIQETFRSADAADSADKSEGDDGG